MNSVEKMRSEIVDDDGRNIGADRIVMEGWSGVGGGVNGGVDGGVNGGVDGGVGGELEISRPYSLDKFTLFETESHFYIVGRDKERLRWRVLKIGRSEPTELVLFEDPTTYSYPQCKNLLEDINEVNKLRGGRKFVTNCYGIVGFVKFLGPYYILLITERKEIGRICGHAIYAVAEYKMIPVPHSTVMSYMDRSERENRYKKLLCLVDIRKDFFFSNSYPVMNNLQKNMNQTGVNQSSNGSMFVWNHFLTHHIRNYVKSTLWTVALVHGFFKQIELSAGGKNFLLTLIARRSIKFAGTRYNKRGVNELGDAANDVEIEQIVSQESHDDKPYGISSFVQIRGSIPLPWSQQHNMWTLKPKIIFSETNLGYQAMQRHFRQLYGRYGSPIILLNLVKTSGKNRQEALISGEYQKGVDHITMNMDEEYELDLVNLDLDATFKTKGADALAVLKDIAMSAQKQIGLFFREISEPVDFKTSYDMSSLWANTDGSDHNNTNSTIQKGVLRSNCLDSLDRTNAAQYDSSVVALGFQLHALGLTGTTDLDLKGKLALQLMDIFEALGNALAEQYGGSEAHSKIFAKARGQWKPSTKFLEFFKSVKRHYSNAFLDDEKQEAMNIWLGEIRPDIDQSAVVDGVSKFNSQRRKPDDTKRIFRSRLKTSQSDSEVHYKGSSDLDGASEITSTDTDSRCTTPRASSSQILYMLKIGWFGSFRVDPDIEDTQSLTEQSEYFHDDLSSEGSGTVDSSASSFHG